MEDLHCRADAGTIPSYASYLRDLSRVENTNKNRVNMFTSFGGFISLPVGDATESGPHIESHHQFARWTAVRPSGRHVAVLRLPRGEGKGSVWLEMK